MAADPGQAAGTACRGGPDPATALPSHSFISSYTHPPSPPPVPPGTLGRLSEQNENCNLIQWVSFLSSFQGRPNILLCQTSLWQMAPTDRASARSHACMCSDWSGLCANSECKFYCQLIGTVSNLQSLSNVHDKGSSKHTENSEILQESYSKEEPCDTAP